MVVYGGDEVSALVFDIGTSTTKVGWAGEDSPTHVFPSFVASHPSDPSKKWLGENYIYAYREGLEISSPYSSSSAGAAPPASSTTTGPTTAGPDSTPYIQDWDAYEAILDYSYESRLRLNPSEHPLLLIDPTWCHSKEQRDRIMTLAFEKYNVPALYFGKSSVLSCFAAGKSAGLVVESGAGVTCVSPVFDGHLLQKGIQKQPIAGDFLLGQAARRLELGGMPPVIPRYLIKSKLAVDSGHPSNYTQLDERLTGATASFHQLAVNRALADFKETVSIISPSKADDKVLGLKPKKNYEFPDGYNSAFGLERYKIPESLFDPSLALSDAMGEDDVGYLPMAKLIINSVQQCDVDIRNLLLSNILLTGGNTLIPGFAERLNTELYYGIPGAKIKIQSAGNGAERKFSSWIGGSIVASLGTFQQSWISKAQYEESGVNVTSGL